MVDFTEVPTWWKYDFTGAEKDPTGQFPNAQPYDFLDVPGGMAPNFRGYLIKSLRMDFEVHLVAMAGEELGHTYGGFKWGFRFTLPDVHPANPAPDDYVFTSYDTPSNDATSEFRQLAWWYLPDPDLNSDFTYLP